MARSSTSAEKTLDAPGYDSPEFSSVPKARLGIATKIILRIVKPPRCVRTLLAAFDSTNEAGAACQRHHRRRDCSLPPSR